MNPESPLSPMPEHLPDWTLEQLAEGELSETERARAEQHLLGCGHCQAELESYQMLFCELAQLPLLEPSADFAVRVMARVRVRESAWARVQAWLPSTTRGWAMLAGLAALPSVAVAVLLVWVTESGSTGWAVAAGRLMLETATTLKALGNLLMQSTLVRSLPDLATQGALALLDLPLPLLPVLLFLAAAAMPVALWSLIHLTRTSDGANYAQG